MQGEEGEAGGPQRGRASLILAEHRLDQRIQRAWDHRKELNALLLTVRRTTGHQAREDAVLVVTAQGG